MNLINRRLTVITCLALVLAASSLRVSAQSTAGGRLRLVHAVPGAPAVDIAIDKIPAARALEYASATRFLHVPAGDHTITITSDGKALFEGKVSVGAGQAETVIAQGAANAVELGVYEDDLGPVAPGNTRLTASHAVKDAPAVDVLRGDGSPLIQGLKYSVPYGAFDIPATAMSIAVVPAGGDVGGAIVKADNLPLIAGTHNRLVALGALEGETKPSYLLLTAAADAENPGSSALLRVIHANPATNAVDVYVGDKLFAPALPAGGSTPHIVVAAGSVDVALRAGGSAVDNPPISKVTLTLGAGQALSLVVTGAEAQGDMLKGFDDNVATLASNKARIHVINAAGEGTATAKLGGVVATASAAKPDPKGVEVPAGIYNLTVSVDNPPLQASVKQPLSGGVLYDIVITGDNKLVVAATGLNEQPGSVPGEEVVAVAQATTAATQAAQPTQQPTEQASTLPAATDQAPTEVVPTEEPTVEPSPTIEPTQPEPPTEVAQEPTEPPTPRPPQNQEGIIATVQTNEGVNLKIREYPRTDARTLALVPSGSALVVTGVRGPVVPTGQPTRTPGPTATVSAEGVTMDSIWLFVTWTASDGGAVTGWINAPYVAITRNGRAVREIIDILSFRQIPQDTPGEVNSAAVTPVVDSNDIIGTVIVNEGTNLQLRRTPGIDGESLALIPAGAQLVVVSKAEVQSKGGVVGEPASTFWFFVRYATDTGTIVGWVNSQYIELTRNQRKVDISEVPTTTQIERGFIEGNATAVKPPAPPGIIATVDKINQGANLQLRRDPAADAESLALIPAGSELTVLGRSGDGNWLNVRFDDKEGWVNSQYVTVTKAGKAFKIGDITIVTGETDSTGLATPGPSPTPTTQG